MNSKNLGLILSILCFYSCLGTGQVSNASQKNFKYDLEMTVNGKRGKGMMTVPLSATYKIELAFPARVEILQIWNCHGEIITEKEGLLISKKTHIFYLAPFSGLGTDGFCPILIKAYDVEGRNAYGFIELENEVLNAALFCNFDTLRSEGGVSVCQTKEGLTLRILFFESVLSITDVEGSCGVPQPLASGYGFEIILGEGLCRYNFKAKKDDRYHRMVLYGYSDQIFDSIGTGNQ